MQIPYKDFNFSLSIASGQCFEWQKHEDWFYGQIFPGSVLKIKQVGDSREGYLEYEVFGKSLSEEQIKEYFSLNENYREIIESFNKDPFINHTVKNLHGLRLINQYPWRCLNSFIISANNSVLNITRSVQKLSEFYGNPIKTDVGVIHEFPSPEKWKNISEKEMRDLKLGFRSKYLAKVPLHINDAEKYFDKLKQLPYKAAKEQLIQIPGIGSKVADCILLYSLSKKESYPVDVWLRRATHEVYFRDKKPPNDEKLRDWAFEYFGPNAGIAHMYLFVYRRTIGEIKP